MQLFGRAGTQPNDTTQEKIKMETKTCSKCKTVKNETEFSRRGAGRQNVCKTCFREYHKGENTPRPVKQPHIPAGVGERVVALEAKLRLIARQNTSNPDSAEDCYSNICEYLLTHMRADDPDERYLANAKLTAKNRLAKERAYNWYVTDTDGTDDDIAYLTPDTSLSPEDAIIQSEQAQEIADFIATLSPKYQIIISMLSAGEKKIDIAAKLHVHPSNISYCIEAISKNMQLQLQIS